MTSVRETIEQQGYAVVPTGIEPAALDAVVSDLWGHLGADPDDEATWYRDGVVSGAGMMEMYHYQSMWDIRQHPKLYDVFRDVHGTDRLWVSIDRVAMKLPARPGSEGSLRLHWDTDINRYPDVPFHVQGVLALADTPAEMGGFECAPGAYRDLDAFVERLRSASDAEAVSRSPDFSAYETVAVPLRAGEILIWTSLLPHGNGVNRSNRPRCAQYVSMNPAPVDEAQAKHRVEAWEQNRPAGRHSTFPGDKRGIEEARPHPARLTPLGRRLLGADPWPEP